MEPHQQRRSKATKDVNAGARARLLEAEQAARRQAEAAAKAQRIRAQQQADVAELGQQALRGIELQALMEAAVDRVASCLDVEYAKVLELLLDGNALLLRAGVGWREGLVGQARVGAGKDSQAGYTLVSGSPVVVEDLRAETRFTGPPLLFDHGVVSGVSVIISGRNRPFGVLGAHTTQRRAFTRDDANFLQSVANVLATAVDRRQVEEELKEELQVHVQLNAALREAAEARDRALAEAESEREERGRLLASEQAARAEAERRRDEAEHAHASLQTFLGVVAHDLRTPLTSIKGYADLLTRSEVSPETRERSIVSIQQQARRMNQMIGDLVDAVGIGLGQFDVRPERADLAQLARRSVEARQVTARQHRLLFEAPRSLHGAWDSWRISQVLDNLLDNAIKYSAGGEVRVRVREEDGQAVVSVSDQGVGIRPEELPRLFQLFSRLEPSRRMEGTGLGLYIAHGIVQAHGGRIWAASAGPGKGSTFTFALPIARPGEPSEKDRG